MNRADGTDKTRHLDERVAEIANASRRLSVGAAKPAAAGDFFAEPVKRPVLHVSA